MTDLQLELRKSRSTERLADSLLEFHCIAQGLLQARDILIASVKPEATNTAR